VENNPQKDVRVKIAKVRLQERAKKNLELGPEEPSKRRRLAEIEDKAMAEDDPDKLNQLFEQYKADHLKGRGNDGEQENKCNKLENTGGMQEVASSSQGGAVYQESSFDAVECMDVWEHLEKIPQMVANADNLEQKVDAARQLVFQDDTVETAYEDDALLKTSMQHDDHRTDYDKYAWGDINDIALPLDLVKKARKEEMMHMKNNIFKVVKKEEAWRKTGRAPISTKWVDTDKTHGTGTPMVRSRWVARDFKDPKEKDREDLFSATPPIELMRYMLSRLATVRKDGAERKTMHLDVKEAHLAPLCEQDVYVELPEEAEVKDDECGKLVHWLHGCRSAAQTLLGPLGEERLREA
jgi:hypothetical protein